MRCRSGRSRASASFRPATNWCDRARNCTASAGRSTTSTATRSPRGSKMRAARRSSTPRRRRTRGDGADSSERGRRVRPRALLGVDQRQRGRRHLPGHRGARRIAAPRRQRQAGEADADRPVGRLRIRGSTGLSRLRDDGLSNVRRTGDPSGCRRAGARIRNGFRPARPARAVRGRPSSAHARRVGY